MTTAYRPSAISSGKVPAIRMVFVLLFTFTMTSWSATGIAIAGSAAEVQRALWLQSGSALSAWSHLGIEIANSASAPAASLAWQRAPVPTCARDAIDEGSIESVAALGECRGRDPMRRGAYLDGSNYYNGGTFYFAAMTSPIHQLSWPASQLVASWDASTPGGTWLQVHVRVREAGTWTHWYRLPIWAADTGTVRRHSVDGQHDRWGQVKTDTFVSSSSGFNAYQLQVTLFSSGALRSPSLRLVGATVSADGTASSSPPMGSGAPVDLPVPQRSQMLPSYRGASYGGGGEAWCSPTSTSMIMAYWSRVSHRPEWDQPVPFTASATYDATYDGTGNWPFNTAYAASRGLVAYVTRLSSLTEAERWIRAGIPLALSVAFHRGELPGEPVQISDGHLLVLRGFTRNEDPITNDPAAASDSAVRIIYPRAALERVWQRGSHGTVYVMYPPGWRTP